MLQKYHEDFIEFTLNNFDFFNKMKNKIKCIVLPQPDYVIRVYYYIEKGKIVFLSKNVDDFNKKYLKELNDKILAIHKKN